MLHWIQRSEIDPYFNLATEEYFLKTATANAFMIWRNMPSVVVGKHQITSREINHSHVESHNLPVIRRITGGGTVYHDLGNINFSFIFTDRNENLIDFRYFTDPVVSFLKSLGLNAEFKEKSNIVINGWKVSGNSAHVYKQKVLYHGTLLFNSDLYALEQAIAGNEDRYTGKSVSSVRAEIINISDLLNQRISTEDFTQRFQSFILDQHPDIVRYIPDGQDIDSIKNLIKEKYSKAEWNYGYSPEYKYENEWQSDQGNFSVSLTVKNGIIIHAVFNGPETYSPFLKAAASHLTGTFHEKKSLSERMKKFTFADDTDVKLMNQLTDHLF